MAKRRMRFVTWARKDPEDETPIRYTFRMTDPAYKTECVRYFTSEDSVPFSMLERVRAAWVEKIEKREDDLGVYWEVFIYED